MSRILETKAYSPDLLGARGLLRGGGATHLESTEQNDTYFFARQGRLKLRESCLRGSGHTTAELIAYRRADERGAHVCTYSATSVERPKTLRQGLESVLGVLVEVHKSRELWMLNSTRIHLDEVEQLGSFIELETPLAESGAEKALHEHRACAAVLGIPPRTHLAGSYSDLLLATTRASRRTENL
jgi:predicted adenylyl cyclase CyaB